MKLVVVPYTAQTVLVYTSVVQCNHQGASSPCLASFLAFISTLFQQFEEYVSLHCLPSCKQWWISLQAERRSMHCCRRPSCWCSGNIGVSWCKICRTIPRGEEECLWTPCSPQCRLPKCRTQRKESSILKWRTLDNMNSLRWEI